jgi:hypothetical protein
MTWDFESYRFDRNDDDDEPSKEIIMKHLQKSDTKRPQCKKKQQRPPRYGRGQYDGAPDREEES